MSYWIWRQNIAPGGDTVHYAEKLNVFKSAQGSYLYDRQGIEYLDLQMWYSAVNFGYRNKRLNTALSNSDAYWIPVLPGIRRDAL